MNSKKIIFIIFCAMFSLNLFSQEILGKDTVVVSRDGTGDFRNIQDAIYAIRDFRPTHTYLLIKNGVYKEKLIIPTWKTGITIIGEDKEKTIITYDDHANINKMGTFKTYTILISGNDITIENLTIENNAAQLGQAVALHVEGDRVIFRNCRFLGNQDTIFNGRENCRQYFENCYIEGTTDFIFGPATAWFENCDIHCKRDSYITAASTPENIPYGLIFNKCRITMASNVNKEYLGRPWRAYAMTLFMNCELPKGIRPQGWHNWGKAENEATARYMEYNNSGDGANISERVSWAKILNKKKASVYTLENVMKGEDGWNPVKK